MVCQRSEHLAHAEPIAGCPPEARVTVLYGNHQCGPSVQDARIIGILAKARQNTDPRVGDDYLEAAFGCGKSRKTCLRHSAVQKHIILKFAHGTNDPCREMLRKSDRYRCLFSAARPKGPMIGALALKREPPKRKGTSPCAKFRSCNPALRYRTLDGYRERRLDRDVPERFRRCSPRHQNLYKWSNSAGPRDPNRPHVCQLARLSRPQQIVGAGEITDQALTALVRICHAVRFLSTTTMHLIGIGLI
jgi:hypothetical protein